MDKFRIRGQVTTKGNMNALFPKFSVSGGIYIIYRSSLDMTSLPNNATIFEPTVSGLGVDKELMYVTTSDRTYLFSMTLEEGEVVWGNEVVTFQANIVF